MSQAPFSFSISVPLTDNNWFNPPWGCYLTNLATLVFTTFQISKHPTFLQCLLQKILELPNYNLKRFNYTNIMWNLSEKKGFITPWILHLYIKKWLSQNFCMVFKSRIHVNVEINKLHWLKQFDMTSTFFFLYFSTFDR